MRGHSRSRSRRGGRQARYPHHSDRDNRRRDRHERPPLDRSRAQADAGARPVDRRSRPGEASDQRGGHAQKAPEQKSGQQKAREAVEREREKARLKKLEREEVQKERALNKERDKARRRETPGDSAEAGATAAPGKEAASVASSQLDEGSARKLFEMLDRGGKGQVSQRDLLIALKKQPPIRRLFGFPVTNFEEGGNELEARLLAIQDSFESGSGLGELGPIFEKLRAGSSAQSFNFEGFCECCRQEPLQARVALAVGLIPREHSTGSVFVATAQWAIVPEGAACPSGLEYKMDMESGRTLARLMPVKAAPRAPVTTRTLACV